MTDSNKKYRIFISAAEPGADSHCAGLITALSQREHGIDFVGEKMASAGAAGKMECLKPQCRIKRYDSNEKAQEKIRNSRQNRMNTRHNSKGLCGWQIGFAVTYLKSCLIIV